MEWKMNVKKGFGEFPALMVGEKWEDAVRREKVFRDQCTEGPPMGTAFYTSEQLATDGYIGLYKPD